MVIEHCEGPSELGPGHPPTATVRVLATLRRFGREGMPCRSLKATPREASGSTLRRRLADWAAINLLQRVHAVLVACCMVIRTSSSTTARCGPSAAATLSAPTPG